MKFFSSLMIWEILIFFFLLQNVFAQENQWKPWQFNKDWKFQSYRFKIMIFDKNNSTPVDAEYEIQVKKTGEKDNNGEELFGMKYINDCKISSGKLGSSSAFGLWGIYGLQISTAFLNPAYAMFLTQVELEVGKENDLLGLGKVKIVGMETIAGYEAFQCEIYQIQGEKKEKLSELSIVRDFPFPAKTVNYQNGEKTSETVLLEANIEK